MKQALKSILYRLSPNLADRWFSFRRRMHNDGVARRRGLPRVLDRYVARHGHVVQAGPFAGMKYVSRATGSTIAPKLVGSYECELHSWIEQLCEEPYERVIDIGCAEGYYVIGMARRLEAASVIGFDLDPLSRQLCAEMARLNDVEDRVTIRGKCTIEALASAVRGRTLIICDCEGFEFDLLDPLAIPGLSNADILVELHEIFRPGVTEALRLRFEPTHSFELAGTQPRDPAQYSLVSFLPDGDRAIALEELRNSPQEWALLKAKAD